MYSRINCIRLGSTGELRY